MSDQLLDEILRAAVAQKASDIHIKVGVPPYIRVNGSLKPFSAASNTREDLDRIVLALLDGDTSRAKEKHEIDIAYTVAGVSRFRCNIFRQRGSLEIVMRTVPYKIPTLDELGLPTVLKHLAMEARGLLLVTGITGSGKSTTIASMVQHINFSLPVHIVTIEDPIEFVYRDELASISQREVGIDTDTFHDALKYVLRQDPDVILLGEMRDRETAATAMTAAETGHLVMSTLHTADAIQTIDRIIDMFPEGQHDQVRKGLSVVLKASVSMRLLPKADGKGLAAALEIMIVTPAIKALIAENKLGEIKQLIMEGSGQYGMQTFDQAILKLYQSKVITKEVALEEATSPAELELAMRGITVGTISASSFLQGGNDDFYKQKAKEFFDRGRRLFEQDLVEDALREIRRALVDYPEYPEAKELLEKINESMQRGQAQLQIKPFIERGLELVAKDQIDEAIAVFNQGLAQDPKNEKLLSLKRGAEDKNQRLRGIKPLMDRAQALQQEGKYDEARAALSEVLTKDAGNSEALDRFAEIMQVQAKQQSVAEIESLSTAAEVAWNEKRWFDTITNWNLVREIQPDHPKAGARIVEAGAQLKTVGVPGLDPSMQGAAAITAAFEKGLTLFLSGQTAGTIAEWTGLGTKVPHAGAMLQAYTRKVEEVHAAHVRYHIARARQLLELGDLGRAMSQLRHALQVDPQSAEARAEYEAQKPMADQAITRYLSDAEGWEKLERLRAAVFCLERAYEIDPAREGLKQRVVDGRNRVQKMKDIHAAMDRRT